MNRVRELLSTGPLFSVTPEMSVLEVARYMSEKRVGAVVILGADHGLLGIFSERDLMERVVIQGSDPAQVSVRDVMTRDVLSAGPDESSVDCMKKMQQRGCRHLPIIESGKVLGMLSLRDLMRVEIDEKDEEIRWMNAYIRDVPPDRQV